MNILSNLFDFYFDSPIEAIRYIRMITCIIGSLFLLTIWANTRSNPSADKSDFGYLLIILALIVWIVIDLDFINDGDYIADKGKIILSTANNFFLLASLPYFKHTYVLIRTNEEPKYTAYFLGILGIALSTAIYFLWGKEYVKAILTTDRIITIITYSLLLLTLTRGFKKREYGTSIILLSVVIFLSLMDTQAVTSRESPLSFHYVLYLCSQIGFVIVLITHASSWREEVITGAYIDQRTEMKKLKQTNTLLQEQLAKREEEYSELMSSKSRLIKELEDKVSGLEKKILEDKKRRLESISDTERKVVEHLNKSNKEIAEIFEVDVSTVKTHVNNIRVKLGIKSREDIMQYVESQSF